MTRDQLSEPPEGYVILGTHGEVKLPEGQKTYSGRLAYVSPLRINWDIDDAWVLSDRGPSCEQWFAAPANSEIAKLNAPAFEVGQRVRVARDFDLFLDQPGWIMGDDPMVGLIGTVTGESDGGDVAIRASDGEEWFFNPWSLEPVAFKPGDRVRIARRPDPKPWFWHDDESSQGGKIGCEGVVRHIDHEGDVGVMVGEDWLFYPPSSLDLLPAEAAVEVTEAKLWPPYDPPVGYQWIDRGRGWRTDGEARYTSAYVEDGRVDWEQEDTWDVPIRSCAEEYRHYFEAVPIAETSKLWPPYDPPVGYQWVDRGRAWEASDVRYTVVDTIDGEWLGSGLSSNRAHGFSHFHYFEAVPITKTTVPVSWIRGLPDLSKPIQKKDGDVWVDAGEELEVGAEYRVRPAVLEAEGPHFFTWVARDCCGKWYCYRNRPTFDGDTWREGGGVRSFLSSSDIPAAESLHHWNGTAWEPT